MSTSFAITDPYAAVAMKHASTSLVSRGAVVSSRAASAPTLPQLSIARIPIE
jgi:hypothetical protein